MLLFASAGAAQVRLALKTRVAKRRSAFITFTSGNTQDYTDTNRKRNLKSFHEKAGAGQEFFCSLMLFSDLFPFSQAASVATLPSALLGERFSLGASWVFSIQ